MIDMFSYPEMCLLSNVAEVRNLITTIFLTGFVRVLGILESPGILLFSFPGLESHGFLCRVMESYGKLNHYKKL